MHDCFHGGERLGHRRSADRPVHPGISDDTEHEAKGVARQDADEVAYINANGGVVGPLYPENDTSAYKKKRIRLPDGMIVYRVIRPEWERMLADLRAGVIQGAIVYDLDRLARDPGIWKTRSSWWSITGGRSSGSRAASIW
jgi:DNA invertase Pin-like site-specific DNA recombinase